jgi:hypothetical protein
MRSILHKLVLIGMIASAAQTILAADASFSVVIRAGDRPGSVWELGIGPSGGIPVNTLSLAQYYQDAGFHSFQIGYTSATNTAYVQLQTTNGQWRQVTYTMTGAGLGSTATWTVPGTNLYVSAAGLPVPTGITVANLSFGPALTIISPLSTTTLTAAQNGTSVSRNIGSPVIFNPTNSGGDWVLTGQIAFNGLGAYHNGGAIGNQLQLGFGAEGTAVPEPATMAMIGAGLALFGAGAFARKRGGRSAH